VSGYLAGKPATAAVAAQAAVDGYTTAFWWAAGIFAAGAIVAGVLLRSGAPQIAPGAQPARPRR
jgi:hypothetical protein